MADDTVSTVVGEATATTDSNDDAASTHAVQATRTAPTPEIAETPETPETATPATPAATPSTATPATDTPAAAVTGTAVDGRARIGQLADELLPALIARLSASSLGELEVREGTWRVRLRRAATVPVAEDEAGHRGRAGRGAGASTHADGPDATGSAAPGQTTARAAASSAAQRDPGRIEATSPAVGYYAPREAVAAGQNVRQGDVLGHIDVLGVRQEVVAPLDGLLVRHLAESGEAVEYGQPLVRLERLARAGRLVGDADVVAVSIAAAPVAGTPPVGAAATNGSGPADTADARRGPATGSTPDAATR
jgi:acetyl-CoA carboxylase biotin carboxyl carrier protein